MELNDPKDGTLRRFACLLLLTFSALNQTPASANSPNQKIKQVPTVRILVDRSKSVHIEGFDLVFSNVDSNDSILREDKRTFVDLKCSYGAAELKTRAGKKLKIPANGMRIESLGGFLRVNDKQYREALYVHPFNGDCLVVNHLDIEKYIAGLLDSEMNANWNLDALKTQAIAARTYALYQMKENNFTKMKRVLASTVSGISKNFRPPFDLDSSVKDQVYEGAQKEKFKAIKAVEETRGLVLTYENEPIKAFYHSTCGGYTEAPEKVWGSKFKYLQPVRCGYCESSPRFNWSYQANMSELTSKLKKEKLLKGELALIQVHSRYGLGRVNEVDIVGTEGRTTISATKLRLLVGASSMLSTDFNVVKTGDGFSFTGHGSGHGVGMCQWGAKAMADRGIPYLEILKRYYPQASLTRYF